MAVPPFEKIAYFLKEAPPIHGTPAHLPATSKFDQIAAKEQGNYYVRGLS